MDSDRKKLIEAITRRLERMEVDKLKLVYYFVHALKIA